ncbi:hypothetical protein BC833DRAFT_603777 [Globomyces pollinis-pini]|nr:hypothetical protein BC833DRAFT_603777 [Globomyces pollinis-pini]
MNDINDTTVHIIYISTLTLLSASLLALSITLINHLRKLSWKNTQKYQIYLIVLTFSLVVSNLCNMLLLMVRYERVLHWLYHVGDFVAITISLFAEIEILIKLQVIMPLSTRQINIIQIVIVSYSFLTGGCNAINNNVLDKLAAGFTYRYIEDSSIFAQWGKYCMYAWYGGLGAYVIGQSCFVAYLMYNQYNQITSANKTVIRKYSKRIIINIVLFIMCYVVGMGLLVFGIMIQKIYPTENAKVVNSYFSGMNSCVKSMMGLIFPRIFNSIKGFCLSKSSASAYKKEPTKQREKTLANQ